MSPPREERFAKVPRYCAHVLRKRRDDRTKGKRNGEERATEIVLTCNITKKHQRGSYDMTTHNEFRTLTLSLTVTYPER